MQQKRLIERQWKVVPVSHEQSIELSLILCTGIIMQPAGVHDAPYLVVHSGPTQIGGYSPVLAMNDVMTSKEFEPKPSSDGRSSMYDILSFYEAQLQKKGQGDNKAMNVYMVSGSRGGLVTDLAFLRYFLAGHHPSLEFLLMGAELNNPTRMVLVPSQRKIHLCDLVKEDSEPKLTYDIGQRYEINLGK